MSFAARCALPVSRRFNSTTALYGSTRAGSRKKTTLLSLYKLYEQRKPISLTTAYDYPTAIAAEESGVDIVLCGDSLANVALGLENTHELTLEAMAHHCMAVRRGLQSAFLIGDMPFGTYEVSPEKAVENAVFLKRKGAIDGIKLEGCRPSAVKAITNLGIPVMAHLGLTPQTSAATSGFRVQAKTAIKAFELFQEALAVQEAGAKFVLLEAIPEPVGRKITQALHVPTIGIGAGHDCNGQALVQNDVLGITRGHRPKFCKTYENLGMAAQRGLEKYVKEVRDGSFPQSEHIYEMEAAEESAFEMKMKSWSE